jgi:hypothetical protein
MENLKREVALTINYKKKEMDFIDRLNELGVISFKTLLIIRKKELQKDMIKINTKNIKMATN